MQTKILVIGIIKKDNEILMRKKPAGSLPYEQTWYIFGSEPVAGQSPEDSLKSWLQDQVGVEVEVVERVGWDSEVKVDHDGQQKQFIYLDVLCEYQSGEARIPQGAEQIAWVPVDRLGEYDLVPPSVKLFEKMGYL